MLVDHFCNHKLRTASDFGSKEIKTKRRSSSSKTGSYTFSVTSLSTGGDIIMESYPTDPLEGLDYNYTEDSKCGYEDSLFSEPSWMEASKNYCSQRPTIPSSEIGVPHSYSPKKKKKDKDKDTDKDKDSEYHHGGIAPPVKKYSLPDNKISDPKVAELLHLCRNGWTLSKGQKNKPQQGKVNLSHVKDDIQMFADRYSDARSKSSASKGTGLNTAEEGRSFRPKVWPNKDAVSHSRANSHMFRAPDVMKSTLGSSTFSFPKDIRMHPGERHVFTPVHYLCFVCCVWVPFLCFEFLIFVSHFYFIVL